MVTTAKNKGKMVLNILPSYLKLTWLWILHLWPFGITW
jgi:hypothetical protein